MLHALQTGDAFAKPASTNGSAMADGVAGGSFDIGKSSLTSILSARYRGFPFVMLAPDDVYDPKAPNGMLIVTQRLGDPRRERPREGNDRLRLARQHG